jgi:hypothetical protein
LKMPFGKHAGTEVDSLPLYYLAWLVEHDWLREPLKSAVEAEREHRAASQRQPKRPAVEIRTIAKEIAAVGFRELAKRCHPDRGGDHARMVSQGSQSKREKNVARRRSVVLRRSFLVLGISQLGDVVAVLLSDR